MRFDPNIVRPEEPPLDEHGELVLRDDLAELAAQLQDDAAHLANCYPAKLPSFSVPRDTNESRNEPPGVAAGEVRHLRRSSQRLWRAMALVASVAGLILGAGAWRLNQQPLQPTTTGEQAKPSPPRVERIETAAAPIRAREENASVIRSLPGVEPQKPVSTPASPSLFLHEYSGPELEGLYDLMEEPEENTISI